MLANGYGGPRGTAAAAHRNDPPPPTLCQRRARETPPLRVQNMGPIVNGDISALPYSSQYLINVSGRPELVA